MSDLLPPFPPSIPRPSLVSDRIVIHIDEDVECEGDQSTSRLVDCPPLSPSTQYQSLSSASSIGNSLVPTHSSCTHTTQNNRPSSSPPSHQLAWKGMVGGCAGDGSLCSVCLGVFITLCLIVYCFIDVRMNRPEPY